MRAFLYTQNSNNNLLITFFERKHDYTILINLHLLLTLDSIIVKIRNYSNI